MQKKVGTTAKLGNPVKIKVEISRPVRLCRKMVDLPRNVSVKDASLILKLISAFNRRIL